MDAEITEIIEKLKASNTGKLKELIDRLKTVEYIKDERFERAALKIRVEDFIPFELINKDPDDFSQSFYIGEEDDKEKLGLPFPFYMSETEGRSTSAFHMIAIMVQLLDVEPGDEIIVLGAKSGYLECIISEMAVDVHVTIIEAVEDIARITEDNITRLGYSEKINVRHASDPIAELSNLNMGSINKILITGKIPSLPVEVQDILKPGGFVLAPIEKKGGKYEEFFKIINTGGLEGLKFEYWGSVSFSPLIRHAVVSTPAVQNIVIPEVVAAFALADQFARKYERLKYTIQKSKEFSFSYLYAYDTNSHLLDVDEITDQFMKQIEESPISLNCTQEFDEIFLKKLHFAPSFTCGNLSIEFFPVPRLGLFSSISRIEFEVDDETKQKIIDIVQTEPVKDASAPAKPELRGTSMRFQLNMYFMISASGIIICNFELATIDISWPVEYYYKRFYVDILRATVQVFKPEQNIQLVLEQILSMMYKEPSIRDKLRPILITEKASFKFPLNSIIFEEYLPNEVLTIPVPKADFEDRFTSFKTCIASPRFDHKFMEKYSFGITGNLDILYFIAAAEEEAFQDLTYSSSIAYLRILSDYVFLLNTSDKLYRLTKSSFGLLHESMKQITFKKNPISSQIEYLKDIELTIMQRFYQLDIGFLIEDYNKIAAIAARFSEKFAYEDVRMAFEKMIAMFINTLKIETKISNLKNLLLSLKESYKDVNDIVSSKQQKTMNYLLFFLTIVQSIIAAVQIIPLIIGWVK